MNDSYMYLNPNELLNKIELLKKERQKMYDLLYKIITDFSGMKSYWNGDTGIQTLEYLNDYIKDFPNMIRRIDKDIEFLENVVKANNEMTNTINSRINENANIEMSEK